jgi:uroporphyrinogen-III synthase
VRPIYLISKTSHKNGYGVIHVPILSISFLHPPIDFNSYDGLIITSKEGARALQNYTLEWQKLNIVCVGEATANEIRRLGGVHITVAAGYGDSIVDVLKNQERRWLYLRPRSIASSWPQYARDMGNKIDEVVIYETTCNESMEAVEIACDGILIFTSPSSIECFLKRYSFASTYDIVTIGTTTQKALPLGIPSILSEKTTIESCIEMAQKLSL